MQALKVLSRKFFMPALLLVGCKPLESGKIGQLGKRISVKQGLPIETSLKYYNHFPFNNVYTIDVSIGNQVIEAVLDTGSSNLLAIGDEQRCPGCVNKYGYKSVYTPSNTSKPLSNSGWSMNFAPIGSAEVEGYSDTVAFAGYTLQDFDFGLVTFEEGIPNIWGIAYAGLARPSNKRQKPLFDALLEQGKLNNQFSLRLCGLKKGTKAVFGGFDPDLGEKLKDVQWTGIVKKLWYPVAASRLYINEASGKEPSWQWSLTSSQTIIVDSGTTPLTVPTESLPALVSVLSKAAAANGVDLPTSFWPTTGPGGMAPLSDAEIAKFPSIQIDLPLSGSLNKNFTLTMTPQNYLQKTEDGKVFLGIEPADGSLFILGTVFMENYVVLHERGDPAAQDPDPTARIGFYPIAGFCN